jgi:RNA polymerase sigma factor (sigma-70 family)
VELQHAELDDLVARARLGDAGAFEELWRALSPRVAAYIRSRGVASVDDATSEVFLGVFSGLAHFVGDGDAFRSWLFTLAHHKSVDAFRRIRPESAYDSYNDNRTTPSAEDSVTDRMLAAPLEAALARLPATQREVLVLRVVGQLSVDEVSAIMGRSPGSVRQMQKRAIASLRRLLDADEVSEIRPSYGVPNGGAPAITQVT